MSPEHEKMFPVRYFRAQRSLFILTATDRLILAGSDDDLPSQCAADLTKEWTDSGVVKRDLACTCGAKSIGALDFGPQHSSWCKHHLDKIGKTEADNLLASTGIRVRIHK